MKTFSKNRFLLIGLVCLLFVVSCFSFTSAWFTDSDELNGDITEPVITPKLYDGNTGSSTQINNPIYWNYANRNTSLPIYVRFDSDTNVTNLILRLTINIEWGTINNNVFEVNNEFSNINIDNEFNFVNVLNPITTSCVMGKDNTENPFTMPQNVYFYNAVYSVPVSSFTQTPNYICVFDNFSFTENSLFDGYKSLTAKIEVSVEADFANELTIDKWENETVIPPQDWEVYDD